MEDLAHFIQSMSEKYGLLDASSHKRSQIQDSSSAASNSSNTEESSAQGSSWEYLSIFISGQSTDSSARPGSIGLEESAIPAAAAPLHPELTSPLYAFANCKMIDINEEAPESPLDTSQVVIEEQDHSDFFPRAPLLEAHFSRAVTISDPVPNAFHPRDQQEQALQLMDEAPRNLAGQVLNSSKGSKASSRADSCTSLQETHHVREEFCTMDALGSSNASYGPSSERIESIPERGDTCRNRATAQKAKLSEHKSCSSSGIAQARSTVVGRVASSSGGLEIGPESGEDIALHEYAVSSRRSSSRLSVHSEAGGTDTDCQESYESELREEVDNNESRRKNPRHDSFESTSVEKMLEEQELRERGITHTRGDQERGVGSSHHNRACNFGEIPQRFDTSNEVSPCDQQENYFLPNSSIDIHSRAAHLNETSKKLFASMNVEKHSPDSNLSTLELLDSSSSPHKSPSESENRVLKKARSFKDSGYGENEKIKEKQKEQKLKSCKSGMSKNIEVESTRPHIAGSFGMSPNVVVGSYCSSDEAQFLKRCCWDPDHDFNLGSAGDEPGSLEAMCSYINKMLCDNGFSPLECSPTSSPEFLDKTVYTLCDVIRNYERREKLVQELLAERNMLRQEENRSNELAEKLESEAESLKQKLAAAEKRAELANAASEKTFAALRKEHQRLEASHAGMLQRCSQLEHVCRAKERALRKLQEKIQGAVQREERQRVREKEWYEKLKHKVAISQKAQGEVIESNFLLRDLKPACIVGIYERQRAADEAEMKLLREENSRLCQELREKENSLLKKMQAMSAAEADQAALDQREQVLIHQLTEVPETLQAVNQREDLKDNVAKLQAQLKIESAENNPSLTLLQRLQMDAARERKKPEIKSSSTFQTSNSSGCTSFKCQQIVLDMCTRLKVTDPLHCSDALNNLLRVVAAVPRMESFIEQVCDTVFNEGSMLCTSGEDNPVAVQSPEAVPGILQFWVQQLQSIQELQRFKESIFAELWERWDSKATKLAMDCKVAVDSVKELIDLERQSLLSAQRYRLPRTVTCSY